MSPMTPYDTPPWLQGVRAQRAEHGAEHGARQDPIPDETRALTSWQLVADQPTIITGPSRWAEPEALVNAAREQLVRDREEAARQERERQAAEEDDRQSAMGAFQGRLAEYLDPAFIEAFEEYDWRDEGHTQPVPALHLATLTADVALLPFTVAVRECGPDYDTGGFLYFVYIGDESGQTVAGCDLAAYLLRRLGWWLEGNDTRKEAKEGHDFPF